MKTLLLVKEIYAEGFRNLGNIIVKNYFKAFMWFSIAMFVVVLYASFLDCLQGLFGTRDMKCISMKGMQYLRELLVGKSDGYEVPITLKLLLILVFLCFFLALFSILLYTFE